MVPKRRIPIRSPSFSAGWRWVFVAQLANVAGTWAVIKLVSNFASVPEFGRFGIILAIAYGVNTLLFGPLAGWAQRHFQEAREADAYRAYFRTLLLALIACTLIGGGVPLVAAVLVEERLARIGLTLTATALALALGVVMSWSDTAIAVENAALRRRSAAAFLVGATWVRVAAVSVVASLGFRSAPAFAAATATGILVMLPFQLWMLGRGRTAWPHRHERTPDFVPSLRSFMLPLVVWGVPGYVLSFGDRLLLAYFAGPAVVGVYVAMTTATVNVGNAFSSAANRVLEPEIYSVSGAGVELDRVHRADAIVRRTTLMAATAALPLVVVYALWPRPVISFFASDAYLDRSGYLWLMLASTIVFLVGQQLMLRGLVLKRPWVYVPIKFVHAGVLATLLAVLVPRDGLPGAVYSLLLAHTLQLAMVLLVNRYRLGIRAEGTTIAARPYG